MKVAVIGSGAAAMGVLEALPRHDGLTIDLFDPGADILEPPEFHTRPNSWSRAAMADIYRRNKAGGGKGIPLPKTHFGDGPTSIKVDHKTTLWISDRPGGLTNFWGGTMLPLRSPDIVDWPFTSDDLEPFYRHIAQVVGVSGADDGLSRLFGRAFINRPPIPAHHRIETFASAFDGETSDDLVFHGGLNRTALETRDDRDNHCIGCGECMVGCFRGSTFSSTDRIRNSQNGTAAYNQIRQHVRTVDPDQGFVVSEREDTEVSIHGPYDRIFIAAGCLGTTTIVLRSLNDTEEAYVGDSFSINVPIVSFGSKHNGVYGDHFGLANALMVATDGLSGATQAQAQIYPTVKHFWRSAVPSHLWSLAGLFGRPLQHRLHWIRMYLPPPFVNQFAVRMDSNGHRAINFVQADGAMDRAREVLQSWAKTFEGNGFHLLMPLFSTGGTSSHYAAGLGDLGRFGISADGKWGNRAVICDSSIWPETPVQSPTFTIMANAMRMTALSLETAVSG